MRSTGLSNVFVALAACALLAAAVVSVTPSHASAQTCMGTAASPCITPVRADGKGMIGLGLLGGEIGLIIPAIIQNAAHTNEWWPYLVFPLVGIGVGIGSGYALEQATQSSPEIDIGIMVGAFVLLIPTIVGTLALASYTPSSEAAPSDEDMTVDDSDTGDSVQAVQDTSSSSASPDTSTSGSSTSSGSSTPPPSSSTTTGPTSSLMGGPGLVRLDADTHQILLGVPVLGAIARYTTEELASLHMQQQYDMNLPIVSATF